MVIKEKLEISRELQRKINNLGKFNGQKLKIVEGSISLYPRLISLTLSLISWK